MASKLWGHSPCGIFGYSHLTGGYAGGQAEYARVPFADVGPLKIPDGMPDEQVLFLSDIFPTGYMGAEMCDIAPGDVIAVWGAGPVGQFAIASAKLLGAERIIAIDRFPYRLQLAQERAGATDIINYEETSVLETLNELTGGRGPDACIDAVGMEAHGHPAMYAYDRTKQALMLETRPPAGTREAMHACRNGGHRLGDRGVRRIHRQVSHGRGHEPVPHDQDGPVPRPALHEAAARADPAGRDRPQPSSSPTASSSMRRRWDTICS